MQNKEEILNSNISFRVDSFTITEAEDKKWVRIGGIALTPETSRNGISYTLANIKENDGIKSKFFMTHNLEPENVIGHTTFVQNGDKLMYDAVIRNTDKYKDVTEMAKDRFFDVSIDGRYKKLKRIAEGDKTRYEIDGLEIRGLCAVGVGGVASNSLDYAIAEEFNKNDKRLNELNKLAEVAIMEEKEKMDAIIKENEALKAKFLAIEQENKNKVVEQILSINKEHDKAKLIEKDISILEMILDYEKKLVTKEKENKGSAEVKEHDKEETKKESGVIIESDGSITMSGDMYSNFNKDIRNYLR
jgi:hypothetical protein